MSLNTKCWVKHYSGFSDGDEKDSSKKPTQALALMELISYH